MLKCWREDEEDGVRCLFSVLNCLSFNPAACKYCIKPMCSSYIPLSANHDEIEKQCKYFFLMNCSGTNNLKVPEVCEVSHLHKLLSHVHSHFCSIFRTCVKPSRRPPAGGACDRAGGATWPSLHVCVQHDVATPCPVQTRRWLCRQSHCQAGLASGTRCAWHPAEGEGRSAAGPGRLQHLSHRAKGPSGGALNTRTDPGRNDNEDLGCAAQDNT